ncbi:MAG: MFS transporter [Chloroflexia bacterium]|nr:MFS transporter [Chloroflexia bacterium]
MKRRTHLLGPVLALALLPSSFTAAALPLLRDEWATSAAAIGWVFAAYQAGYVLSVLIILPLTDRLPSGMVIGGCTIATSLAFVLFPFVATDVWSASAIRFVAGLGLAGIYMPGTRVVAASAPPERRGLFVGSYVSSFYLGGAISLWTSGFLLGWMPWREAALVLGVLSIIALPLALIATRGVAAPTGQSGRLDPRVLREGPVTRTILGYTGHAWELYVSRGWMAAFLAAALVAQGLDPTEATAQGSQWAALMAGLGMPGVFFGGWFSDRIGRPQAALSIAVASGIISLGFGFLGGASWGFLLAIGCLYGFLISADSAIYSTAITELAPRERLGSAQALQAFIGFGATILAPIVAGWMLDMNLGWGSVFALGGLMSIGLGLPMIRLIRRR